MTSDEPKRPQLDRGALLHVHATSDAAHQRWLELHYTDLAARPWFGADESLCADHNATEWVSPDMDPEFPGLIPDPERRGNYLLTYGARWSEVARRQAEGTVRRETPAPVATTYTSQDGETWTPTAWATVAPRVAQPDRPDRACGLRRRSESHPNPRLERISRGHKNPRAPHMDETEAWAPRARRLL